MGKKKIDTNIIFDHLESSSSKIVVEQGGTRSGKTYNILLWIIFAYCNRNTGKVVTITRKTFPSTRATVMRDFIDILKIYGLYNEANHNKSSSEYKLFGNLVEFISLDQPQKVRGVRGTCCLLMRPMNYSLRIGSSWSLEHKTRLY